MNGSVKPTPTRNAAKRLTGIAGTDEGQIKKGTMKMIIANMYVNGTDWKKGNFHKSYKNKNIRVLERIINREIKKLFRFSDTVIHVEYNYYAAIHRTILVEYYYEEVR